MTRDRWIEEGRAGALTAVVVAGIGIALVRGLVVAPAAPREDAPDLVTLTPVAEPTSRPPVVPPPKPVRRAAGEAAPPNLRSRATELAAPVPQIVLPPPVPLVVAPVAGPGADASSGSSNRPGPGTGAGGIGNGYGAGGEGDGDGSGYADTPPRRIRDGFRNSDIPDGYTGHAVIGVRFHVEVDGRVTGCRVTDGSGDGVLDAATCAAIERRFRYRPALDEDRRPVRSTVVMDYEWDVEDEPRRR